MLEVDFMAKNNEQVAPNHGGLMGGLKSGGSSPISTAQKEILAMLTGDSPLTIPQIAQRRQTSIQAVYKVVWKLKKQGLLEGGSFRGFKSGADLRSRGVEKWSLHAQRFIIPIVDFTTQYAQQQYLARIGNSGVSFRGNTIKLRRDSIEIYSTTHFRGSTLDNCEGASGNHWNFFIEALQGKYGVSLDRNNIRETYCEIAMLENGIAHRQNVAKDRIWYFDPETHRLWLKTDKSFKGNDLEFMGKTARGDARLFEPHLRDWRNPICPTPMQMYDFLNGFLQLENMKQQREYATQQQSLNNPEHIEDIKKQHKRDLPSYFG
jgi:hypothetical protein